MGGVLRGLFGGGRPQTQVVHVPTPTREDPNVEAARRAAKAAERQASGRAGTLLTGGAQGDISPLPFMRAGLKAKMGQ